MTEKEFDNKYKGVDIDTLNDKQFEQFKEDCFEMYEQGGFLERYDSPYDEFEERKGMKFEVVRRARLDEVDIENMPIWVVKFEDGEETYCYPEEITKIENNRLKTNYYGK